MCFCLRTRPVTTLFKTVKPKLIALASSNLWDKNIIRNCSFKNKHQPVPDSLSFVGILWSGQVDQVELPAGCSAITICRLQPYGEDCVRSGGLTVQRGRASWSQFGSTGQDFNGIGDGTDWRLCQINNFEKSRLEFSNIQFSWKFSTVEIKHLFLVDLQEANPQLPFLVFKILVWEDLLETSDDNSSGFGVYQINGVVGPHTEGLPSPRLTWL